jgi:hypothetical protein
MAAISATACSLLNRLLSSKQVPSGAFQEVSTSTMFEAGRQMPDHCLRILRALVQASGGIDRNGAQYFFCNSKSANMAIRPLQLAGWDAAALPTELQPYAMHLQALLPPW